jgi:hypothetical protein
MYNEKKDSRFVGGGTAISNGSYGPERLYIHNFYLGDGVAI